METAGKDQYTVWSTDSNGNFVTNGTGTVSGSSSVLKSLEPSFRQDLNGDGVVGAGPTPTCQHQPANTHPNSNSNFNTEPNTDTKSNSDTDTECNSNTGTCRRKLRPAVGERGGLLRHL